MELVEIDPESLKPIQRIEWTINKGRYICILLEDVSREELPAIPPSVHRVFAELKTDAALIGFAAQYGLFGRETRAMLNIVDKALNIVDKRNFYAEPLEQWKGQQQKVARLVRILDNLRRRNIIGLWDCMSYWRDILRLGFTFSNVSPEKAKKHTRQLFNNSKVYLPDLVPDTEAIKDPAFQAYIYTNATKMLRDELNAELAAGASPLIAESKAASLMIVPKDLLGAIWASFANEFMGRTEPAKKCPNCGRFFFAEHGKQIYCSTACNQKAYHKRKKGAEQTAEGKSP